MRASTFIAIALPLLVLLGPNTARAENHPVSACGFRIPPTFVASSDEPETVELTAGDASIAANGDAQFNGPITLESSLRSLSADEASYDATNTTFAVTGNVSYEDYSTEVRGAAAEYNQTTREFLFEKAEFELFDTASRGGADKVEVSGAGYLNLANVTYTTCPKGKDDWVLKAKNINIDLEKGVGTARSAQLRFKNVPFLYLPYFSYPVTGQRKSGFLLPDIGTSDQRGFELITPYYWNIAPNYDATFVPHYMSDRGLQMGTEFRYMTRQNQGILWGDYLPDDDLSNTDRYQWEVSTQTFFSPDWRAQIDAIGVSDDAYYEDLSDSQSESSQVALRRNTNIEHYDEHWEFMLEFEGYQTIDPFLKDSEKPYKQIPNLVVNGEWNDSLLGLDYKLNTETTYFDRDCEPNANYDPNDPLDERDCAVDDQVTGLRLHVVPEILIPLNYKGLYLNSAAGVDLAQYNLNDVPNNLSDDPDRSVPFFSVDTGAVFDSLAGKNGQWQVSMEPRALYTHIPYEDQTDNPVFDTIDPDFNLVELFRSNRFIGGDRIGDTDQLALGVTSRVFSSATGRQRLYGTIGIIQYFSSRNVTLPDELPNDDNSSDYIAQLGVRISEKWNLDLGYQWNSEQRVTDQSETRLQFNPGPSKVLNLGYRYRRDSLEQTDISMAWPLFDRWNVVGRWNYSLLEDKTLESFAGIEYATCCWGIRLTSRENVSRRTGESDQSISLQFELKGFSANSTAAEDMLGRGILDY
ncbi:MAG: LPS-assembly protein LptD [Gammaproteobacteria bacterium]